MGWLHRTIGLLLGAWLTLVGLTGAFLVYHEELDTWLNAEMMTVPAAPAGQPDFDRMLTVVRAAHPDRHVLFFQRYGHSERESFPFALSAPGADAAKLTSSEQDAEIEVFVDPTAFRVLGERRYHTLFRAIRSFHMELLVPGTGKHVLGSLGAVVLTTVIAGMILWWRDNQRHPLRGLKMRWSSPRPRLLRDLHTVAGGYVALFLAAQVTSGILICEWLTVRQFISNVTGYTPMPSARVTPTDGPAVPVTADMARDAALREHPASDVVWIRFPLKPDGRYGVRLYPTDESKSHNMRQMEISGTTGQVALLFDPNLVSLPTAILNLWMIWIHNGHFLGTPGRIIVLLTGVGLATLFPTGLYIWQRQRQSRRAAQRKRAGNA